MRNPQQIALGNLSRTILSWPAKESPVFVGANVTVTGNLADTGDVGVLWAPMTGQRFLLRGGHLAILAITACTGQGSGILFLCDGVATRVVMPLACIDFGMPASTVIADSLVFDLNAGFYGKNAGGKLRIGSNGTIGTGVIRICGVLWGDEY